MFASMLLLAALASPIPSPAPAAVPDTAPTPSPIRTLGLIRAQFRSHRPPPPFVTYTIERKQLASNGFPDYLDSYTYHVYCRTLDRAALKRQVFRDYARGPLEFDRPAFNEPRDPGPPTADVFEPAPSTPHPERNRLREIFADRKTYELHKLIATDRLYVQGDRNYGVIFTITMGMLQGTPIVTKVHGDVIDGYDGDGVKVDFFFRDIAFPATLPEWYFDKRQYGAHQADAPK
jgi:hypothetical protein